MIRGLLAALGVALLLPGTAAAQSWSDGLYAEARGGVAFLTESELDFGSFDVDLSFDTGWLFEGAFGYAHDSGLRGEIALGYRQNDFDEVELGGVSVSLDGDISAFTGMANAYYDFDLSQMGAGGGVAAKLTPFLGAGVGFAGLDVDGDLGSESDTVFAYQGIIGLSYAFTTNVAATLSYNYFATTDADFDGVDADYDSHNILAGIRYSF